MKAKVESLGKIFAVRNYKSGHVEIKENRVSDGEIELEVNHYRIHMLTVRIPHQMYEMLVDVAKREGVTVSDITRRALSQYLNQYDY